MQNCVSIELANWTLQKAFRPEHSAKFGLSDPTNLL